MKNPELKAREKQFWHHLKTRAKTSKGWDVKCLHRKDALDAIRFTCIHGKQYDEPFFPDDLVSFVASAKGMADQHFQRAVKWCKGEHVDVTPNTWFSIPPLKYPVAPLQYYVQAIDFTPMVKSMNEMAPYIGSIKWTPSTNTITFDEISGGIVSFGNTSSILNELTKACPALATVCRPCPEKACMQQSAPLAQLIPHINDNHQWSREKIADWLDIIALDDPNVDLTIKPKEQKSEQPSIGSGTQATDDHYGTVVLGSGGIVKAY